MGSIDFLKYFLNSTVAVNGKVYLVNVCRSVTSIIHHTLFKNFDAAEIMLRIGPLMPVCVFIKNSISGEQIGA